MSWAHCYTLIWEQGLQVGYMRLRPLIENVQCFIEELFISAQLGHIGDTFGQFIGRPLAQGYVVITTLTIQLSRSKGQV